jgi:hypothetical protein
MKIELLMIGLNAHNATHIDRCIGLSHWTKGCCREKKKKIITILDSDMLIADNTSTQVYMVQLKII